MRTVNEQLRVRYPERAERARRQRAEAIRLFCLECMGGSMPEVRRCVSPACFLYPFRFGGRRVTQGIGERAIGDSGASDAPGEPLRTALALATEAAE